MSEKEPFLEPEPTPEEIEQARRLAEALEGGRGAAADPEALAAAQFLQGLSEGVGGDELARHRLRKELVEAAGKRGRSRKTRWVAAAASIAGAAALGLVLWSVLSPPSGRTLEEREREARAAVASISKVSSVDLASARSEASYDSAWKERLATTLETSRYESLLQQAGGSGSAAPARASQTSGGEL